MDSFVWMLLTDTVRKRVERKKACFCGPKPSWASSLTVLATTWLCLSKTPCLRFWSSLLRYPGQSDWDLPDFNAGITVFLHLLKKKKGYYYQLNNMISVSNLIYRMKKCSGAYDYCHPRPWCWVTISQPLTSMSVAKWSRKSWRLMISLSKEKVDLELINQEIWWICVPKYHLWDQNRDLMTLCQLLGSNHKRGNGFHRLSSWMNARSSQTVFLVFDAVSYEQMTGEKADLTGNQVILLLITRLL